MRPFEAADIPAAGALLAQRHRRHRLAQPLLSPRYEAVDAAVVEVSAAFAADGASGAVALRGGELIAYLLGAPKSAAWGPNIWVESAGHAATEAETVRDLYGLAATRWAEEDRTAHYALVPATDPDLVRAWFRLGFGQQHAHAIRKPERLDVSSDATVRRAERRDVPVLAQLELELARHQAEAPTFSSYEPGSYDESVAEWAADIDSPEYMPFVAEYHGAVVGSAVGTTLEKSQAHTGPARPDNAGFLGFAAVLPQARGLGAGRALGAAVITWAGEAGFDSVVVDWRVTNLLSSRTWPTLGFTETFLRLHRHLGY